MGDAIAHIQAYYSTLVLSSLLLRMMLQSASSSRLSLQNYINCYAQTGVENSQGYFCSVYLYDDGDPIDEPIQTPAFCFNKYILF